MNPTVESILLGGILGSNIGMYLYVIRIYHKMKNKI